MSKPTMPQPVVQPFHDDTSWQCSKCGQWNGPVPAIAFQPGYLAGLTIGTLLRMAASVTAAVVSYFFLHSVHWALANTMAGLYLVLVAYALWKGERS